MCRRLVQDFFLAVDFSRGAMWAHVLDIIRYRWNFNHGAQKQPPAFCSILVGFELPPRVGRHVRHESAR